MTDQRRSAAPVSSASRPGRGLRALLALAAAVGITLAAAPPALAAPGDIAWSVRPATDGEPDKRSWVELELEAGAVAEEEAAVTNLSEETVTFRIDAADGYFTDKGRFSMLPASEESVDAGTWIAAPESVTIEPGAVAIVPFTVTVPENAEPGDHAAGIAASVISQGQDESGTSVGVESRIGFRVMTRVAGEIAPSADVEGIDADYTLSWNPFLPGFLDLRADVVNTGNVRLLLDGTVSAAGASSPLVPEDATQQELLPGDRRSVAVRLDGVWPLFAVGADVRVAPTVVTPEGEQVGMEPVVVSTSVTAVPWPQIVVLLGVALLLVAVFAGRSRSRRRVDALVRAAKEEGLREASRTGD